MEQAPVRESRVSPPAHRNASPPLDFSAPPAVVKAVTEGERLTYGHLGFLDELIESAVLGFDIAQAVTANP